MVAIITEEIVSTAREFEAGVFEVLLDFGSGEVGEALEMGQAVRAAWRGREGWSVEDACLGCGGGGIRGAVGVLPVEEDDTGVKEGEAEGPEEGGQRARGKQVIYVDVDGDLGSG